jgi:sulfoxide reductase heme-binding subunit YedZ
MTTIESHDRLQTTRRNNRPYGFIVLFCLVLFTGAMILYSISPQGAWLNGLANRLFALNTTQSMWYITRSAGITAYLLLWFSTALGLAVSSKILDRLLHRTFTFDFHQFISLLALGFLALHILVLSADQYMPYSLAQILVPFLSPYRPLWVGIGVIGLYLTVLVTVTYYLRQKIGMKAFRTIHVLSLVAYLGATMHGFFSGTESSLPVTVLMYFGTFLVIVFLTFHWLLMRLLNAAPSKPESVQPSEAGHMNFIQDRELYPNKLP